MWRLNIGLGLLLVLTFSSVESKCPSVQQGTAKVLCYYEGRKSLDDLDPCACTHLVYSGSARGEELVELSKKLMEKKPKLKILLRTDGRDKELSNLIKLAGLHGAELHEAHAELNRTRITEIAEVLRKELGSDAILLLSLPAKSELIAKYYDLKQIVKIMSLFAVETHFLGDSENETFHPSRLSGVWDMQNTDSVVDLAIGLGVPSAKLVILSPAVAYSFRLKNSTLSTPGSPTLGKPETLQQAQLCREMGQDRWTLERDQDLSAPYAFREDKWIAFEDGTSLDVKTKYSRIRGLAGVGLVAVDDDQETECGPSLLMSIAKGLNTQARAPRGALLGSLEHEILSVPQQSRLVDGIQLSPYRISRVVDADGIIHAIREDTRTEFACQRQGYFVHPRSCNRFYRCVKFDQLSADFTVFEFDCPAGLAFDSRYEVCVWPGSLSEGQACPGSSEIAPVPQTRFVCPETPGYYADPANCRWFFACLDHGKSPLSAYEFRCPFGLGFDASRLLCDWPWLVPGCGDLAKYEATAHGHSLTGASAYIGASADSVNIAAHQSLISGASTGNLVGIQAGYGGRYQAAEHAGYAAASALDSQNNYNQASYDGAFHSGNHISGETSDYSSGPSSISYTSGNGAYSTSDNDYTSGSLLLSTGLSPNHGQSSGAYQVGSTADYDSAHISSTGSYSGNGAASTSSFNSGLAANSGVESNLYSHSGISSTASTLNPGVYQVGSTADYDSAVKIDSSGYKNQGISSAYSSGASGNSGVYQAGFDKTGGLSSTYFGSSNGGKYSYAGASINQGLTGDLSGAYYHDTSGDYKHDYSGEYSEKALPYQHIEGAQYPYSGSYDTGSYSGSYDKGAYSGSYDKGSYLGSSDKGSYLGSSDKGSYLGSSDKGSYLGSSDKGSYSGSSDKGSYSGLYSGSYNNDNSGAYKHDDAGTYAYAQNSGSAYSSQDSSGYSNYPTTGAAHTLTAGAINAGLVGKTTLIDAELFHNNAYASVNTHGNSGSLNYNQYSTQRPSTYEYNSGASGFGVSSTVSPILHSVSPQTVTYKPALVVAQPKTEITQVFGYQKPAQSYVQPILTVSSTPKTVVYEKQVVQQPLIAVANYNGPTVQESYQNHGYQGYQNQAYQNQGYQNVVSVTQAPISQSNSYYQSQNYVSATPKVAITTYQQPAVTVYKNPLLSYTNVTPAPTYASVPTYVQQPSYVQQSTVASFAKPSVSSYEYVQQPIVQQKYVAQPIAVQQNAYGHSAVSQQTFHQSSNSQQYVSSTAAPLAYEQSTPKPYVYKAPEYLPPKTASYQSTPKVTYTQESYVSSTPKPVQHQQSYVVSSPAPAIKYVEPKLTYVSSTPAPIKYEAPVSYKQNVFEQYKVPQQSYVYQAQEYVPPKVSYVSSTPAPVKYQQQSIVHTYEAPKIIAPIVSSTAIPSIQYTEQKQGYTYQAPEYIPPKVSYVSSTPAPVRYQQQSVVHTYEAPKFVSSTPVPIVQYTAPQKVFEYVPPKVNYVSSTPAPVRYQQQSVVHTYEAPKIVAPIVSSTAIPSIQYTEQKQGYTYQAPEYIPPKVSYVSSTPAPVRYQQQSFVHTYEAPKIVSSTPVPIVQYTAPQKVFSYQPPEYLAPKVSYTQQNYVSSTPSPIKYEQQSVVHTYEAPKIVSSTFAPIVQYTAPQKVFSYQAPEYAAPKVTYVSSTPKPVKYEQQSVVHTYEAPRVVQPLPTYQTYQQGYSQYEQTKEYVQPIVRVPSAPPAVKYEQTYTSYESPKIESYRNEEYVVPKGVPIQVSSPAPFVYKKPQYVEKFQISSNAQYEQNSYSANIHQYQPENVVKVQNYQQPAYVQSTTYLPPVKQTTVYKAPDYLPPKATQPSIQIISSPAPTYSTLNINPIQEFAFQKVAITPKPTIVYKKEPVLLQQIYQSTPKPVVYKKPTITVDYTKENTVNLLGFGTVGPDAGLIAPTVYPSTERIVYSTQKAPQRIVKVKKIIQSSTYAPAPQRIVEVTPPTIVVRRPRPKVAVVTKVNDFNPLIVRKLGAVCSCRSNVLRLRKPQAKPDNEYDIQYETDYDVPTNGDYDEEWTYKTPSSAPVKSVNPTIVNLPVKSTTPIVINKPTINIYSSTLSPIIVPDEDFTSYDDEEEEVHIKPAQIRKVKPIVVNQEYENYPVVKPVRKQTEVRFVSSTEAPIKRPVRLRTKGKSTVAPTLETVLIPQRQTVIIEGPKRVINNARGRDNGLSGVDCQRAGLFRHPTHCNKFYSCVWDCNKNKFTVHSFNCPVQLSFDPAMGACNWPSQGPACQGDTLLPSGF